VNCSHDPVDIRVTHKGARCYCGAKARMADLVAAAYGDGPWSYQTLKLVASRVFRASA
jgi:hypothetical protein